MIELQIEGLVGPTHNYAGLAPGNVASANNAQSEANPQAAALQSLEKMKAVHELGLPVAIMPPHPRPALDVLTRLGYEKNAETMLAQAYQDAPELVANIYSSSNMWVANAATVSPSADCADGLLHLTPANLISSLHRSIEPRTTMHYLRGLFPDESCVTVHEPLPVTTRLADEGAANHMRLHDTHTGDALHLFVYGADPDSTHHPAHFPARQQKLASQTIARMHQLSSEHCFYIQQHPDAIDAGVFHNDVIAMSHGPLLLYHEAAFIDADDTLQSLAQRYPWLILRAIKASELSLDNAVSSYFFNAQLLPTESGGITIFFPQECADNPAVKVLAQGLVLEDNPIESVHFLNLRESMKNGGGPACLRLRVPITEEELASMHQGARFNTRLYQRLGNLITDHYPSSLMPSDLGNPELAHKSLKTQQSVLDLLHLA